MEAPPWRSRARWKGRAAPPWKEAYRRRCMERLRSSRAKLLERYRQAGEGPSGAALVRDVMEQEWRALRAPGGPEALPQVLEDPDELAVLEEIQQDLILQEQLVMKEYERSLQVDEECLNAMLDGLDASDKIICPVCRNVGYTSAHRI
ncbi:RPA-interacting protein isoform X1 [Lathamus discolor]|uniref:RPA-interacting protein isoform X1 n=1 Tax=Lathamus discolor TaxID=678569 RepID=UPI0032B7A73C